MGPKIWEHLPSIVSDVSAMPCYKNRNIRCPFLRFSSNRRTAGLNDLQGGEVCLNESPIYNKNYFVRRFKKLSSFTYVHHYELWVSCILNTSIYNQPFDIVPKCKILKREIKASLNTKTECENCAKSCCAYKTEARVCTAKQKTDCISDTKFYNVVSRTSCLCPQSRVICCEWRWSITTLFDS